MKIQNLKQNIKKHGLRVLLFLLFSFLLSLIPYPNKYFFTAARTQGLASPSEVKLPDPPPYPVDSMAYPVPFTSAQAVYISDLPSGTVLYEKNAQGKLPPASTTKVISALVAMKHFRPDDVLKVTNVMKEGKTMGLIPNEELTFESLLYGMLVHSANDAAFAIAQNYPGGLEKFVTEMNIQAGVFGLTGSHFTNPAGLDDDRQYTTAVDLAKMAKIALSDKTFAKIVSTRSITVSDINFTVFHDLKNVNELLGKVAGVAGVKTGQTQNGGEILVSEVKKNGRSVLFVVMKSAERFGETERLINWVFDNFRWTDIRNITPASQILPQADTPQSYYLPQIQK